MPSFYMGIKPPRPSTSRDMWILIEVHAKQDSAGRQIEPRLKEMICPEVENALPDPDIL